MLSACSEDSTALNVPADADTTGVTFASVISRATDTEFVAEDQIHILAINDDSSLNALKVYEYTSENIFDQTDGYITYSDTAEALSFMAFYPVDSQNTSDDFELYEGEQDEWEYYIQIKSNQNTDGNLTLSDFMMAETEATTSARPTLEFKHLLSKVNLTVVSEDEDASCTGASILSQYTDVSYDFEDKEVSGYGETSTFTPLDNGDGSYTAILTPTEDSTKFKVAVKVDTQTNWIEVEYPTALVSGVEYNITLTIKDKDITIDDENVTITNWNTGATIEDITIYIK